MVKEKKLTAASSMLSAVLTFFNHSHVQGGRKKVIKVGICPPSLIISPLSLRIGLTWLDVSPPNLGIGTTSLEIGPHGLGIILPRLGIGLGHGPT